MENIDIPKEVKLYPEKRAKLEKQKTNLIMQIQKSQSALEAIRKDLQRLVDEHNKVQAKLEFLNEIENGD